MRYRLTFAAGLALGYVLGTRAGREQYEKMKSCAQGFMQNPAVRNTAESAAQQSRDLAGRAYHTVSSKVGDRMPDGVGGRVRSMRERAHTGQTRDDDWGTSTP
ncbi:YtxH domain-containing protein [Streptomyces sp. TS71-3]|uniref:YtxH domain-containing protein n=1 Tax=Streptomyces sp. TS71-3 TaxID=2733862 RepID=UPI001B03DC8A|nr:YtxH domain-containing protein [Streptomyces sp. TS71-3]GHJ37772.1 hypothetical protein Sm713_33810 [Streptomyces sp. TS71-3]